MCQDPDNTGDLPPIVVVGNKCDMEDQRVVPTEEGENLAKTMGESAVFLESSAKANINIDNVSAGVHIFLPQLSYFADISRNSKSYKKAKSKTDQSTKKRQRLLLYYNLEQNGWEIYFIYTFVHMKLRM